MGCGSTQFDNYEKLQKHLTFDKPDYLVPNIQKSHICSAYDSFNDNVAYGGMMEGTESKVRRNLYKNMQDLQDQIIRNTGHAPMVDLIQNTYKILQLSMDPERIQKDRLQDALMTLSHNVETLDIKH